MYEAALRGDICSCLGLIWACSSMGQLWWVEVVEEEETLWVSDRQSGK